jgi:hypothetical protein
MVNGIYMELSIFYMTLSILEWTSRVIIESSKWKPGIHKTGKNHDPSRLPLRYGQISLKTMIDKMTISKTTPNGDKTIAGKGSLNRRVAIRWNAISSNLDHKSKNTKLRSTELYKLLINSRITNHV